jgi:hypothetical protein
VASISRVVVALAWLVCATPAGAQESVGHLGLAVGASSYDLNGTGVAPTISARLDIVNRRLVLQASFSYLNYQPPAIKRTHVLFTETQVQLQIGNAVRPFIGVGAGSAADIGRNLGQDFVLSASTGARLRVQRGWNGLLEVRLRSVQPFTGSTADWLMGVSKELGG